MGGAGILRGSINSFRPAMATSPCSSSAPFMNVCDKELSEFVSIFDI